LIYFLGLTARSATFGGPFDGAVEKVKSNSLTQNIVLQIKNSRRIKAFLALNRVYLRSFLAKIYTPQNFILAFLGQLSFFNSPPAVVLLRNVLWHAG